MEVDNRQQSQLSGVGYEGLRYGATPQFTNPWAAATAAPSSQMGYSSVMTTAPTTNPQQVSRPTSISIPYAGLPVTASAIGAGTSLPVGPLEHQNLLGAPQDLLNTSRTYGSQYPASATLPQYPMDYGSNPSRASYNGYSQDTTRRSSHPSVPTTSFLGAPLNEPRPRPSSMIIDSDRLNQRNSFSDALDASQGMVSLSQADITPRNIYGTQGSSRGSSDSYPFPHTHSAHSSISSASYTTSYYNGSVAESSVTDYSSASESVDLNHRTLPRPSSLAGDGMPPAPQSMMGSFSSKVSSSSQKKHKCKICDKRFTRPSSLQTHMYSHTGEKPFACEVEGCGRHFSVVSNLRRHRKVHKGERDHPSPDDS